MLVDTPCHSPQPNPGNRENELFDASAKWSRAPLSGKSNRTLGPHLTGLRADPAASVPRCASGARGALLRGGLCSVAVGTSHQSFIAYSRT